MVRPAPPERYTGTPHLLTLPAGTVLSRVHRVAYGSCDFNPVASHVVFGGGRFDPTVLDPYGFLYAGESDATAVAEALLRDIDPDDRGYRFLHKKYWTGKQISRIRLRAEVQLVTLRTGQDLGAVGAGTWLVDCEADDYPQSRAWAHWLRTLSPEWAGLTWLSKREPGTASFILFADRCPEGLLAPAGGPLGTTPCNFDDPEGFSWLREHLTPYRVSIRARAQRGA